MGIINTALNAVFDLYFSITGFLGKEISFWILAAVVGVVFMYIFKFTSNQKAIRKIKDHVAAGFLEVRLFKDDLGQMLKAQGMIFANGLKYFISALKPLVFLSIPFVLIAIQVNLWYGVDTLTADETRVPFQEMLEKHGIKHDLPRDADKSAMVVVKIDGDFQSLTRDISLEGGEGVEVVTPALRIESLNEVNWRIKAVKAGEYNLKLKVGGKELTHTVFVGGKDQFRKIEPRRVRGALDEFLSPGQPAISPEIPVTELSVVYPVKQFNLLGFEMDWIIAFLIISMIFGFALKGVIGVEI